MRSGEKQKLIVIVGPTASGKSALAVRLAKKFNGEIISADSRQVYRGLDIGTGKITRKEMAGIRHHLLDVVSPRYAFTAAQFKRRAERAIREIAQRGKTPIIAGGTAFWIDALVYGFSLPEVAPNARFRRALEKKSPSQLLALLKKYDLRRAREIEQKNPRRLIRAIEIARILGRVPKLKKEYPYETLWIGIALPERAIALKIKRRLAARLQKGMIAEAKRLRHQGLSWKRFYDLGLEYRALASFLEGKISREEMLRGLERDIARYAKRQMRWWKRNHAIKWIKNPREAESLARKFLSSSSH